MALQRASVNSLDDWRRVVGSTFLPHDATVDGDERFRGSLEGVATDQVAVIRVGSVAQHEPEARVAPEPVRLTPSMLPSWACRFMARW